MRSVPLLVVVVALAGCGSSSAGGVSAGAGAGGPAGTGAAAAGGVGTGNPATNAMAMFDGTVTLNGAANVQGRFEQPVVDLPCTTLAQTGDGGRFPVPSPGDVGGQRVGITLVVSMYTGPGQYGIDRLRGSGAGVVVGSRHFTLDGAATASLSVQPDGSGQLQLSNLPAAAGQPGPPLSGTLTWTCRSSLVGGAPSQQPSAQP
jgi:hypothetical protein